MQRVIKILNSTCILLLVILFAVSGCAVKKNPYASGKKKTSYVNTSQLGRNKYYFSVGYQKKLQKSVKR
jgi:hypothetical protein